MPGVKCQWSSLRCRGGGGGVGAAQQPRSRRVPCHVHCLQHTKHLHQWSGSSEVVEYPKLLLVGRHQHRFKRWFVLYAFMLRLLQLNIPPPQGGNGWASGDHLPGGYSIGQSGNQLYLRPRSLFHSWWQQFLDSLVIITSIW